MNEVSQGISVFSGLRQSANGRYKSLQGTYNPRVGGPYRGPSKKPKFRSKMELRLMLMLDSPEANNVMSWEYESRRIPYVDKSSFDLDNSGRRVNPTRNYVIDFIINLKTVTGIQTYWVEVKSINDIEVNKRKKRTKNAMLSEKIRLKNYCKWIQAAKIAHNVGARFLVVTERELDMLKNMIYGSGV